MAKDIKKERQSSPAEVYSKIQYCGLNPGLSVVSKAPWWKKNITVLWRNVLGEQKALLLEKNMSSEINMGANLSNINSWNKKFPLYY